MFVGTPPFTRADPNDAYYKQICTNKHEIFWQAHANFKNTMVFSESFKNLMNSMLAFDPT